tara:strand:- start:24989 stop:25216 length:228 start_codon:yes stop_codon:yes gene_type:complete
MADRKASVSRDTLETQITVSINLDGKGEGKFETGVPFLDHMMGQIARHTYMLLDEALSRVVIDLSGRPNMEYYVR